jgi:regulator of sirC expression with transglutaminase-like and TPR domain
MVDRFVYQAHNEDTMTTSTNSPQPLQQLADALQTEENDLDPGYLALLLAMCHHPGLDIQPYIGRLDGLATRARTRLGRRRAPERVIMAINETLFEEEGFIGNTENYYDPRNSFLNDVLDRRMGIPITLSVIYLSVARRLDQPIYGVGLPLHFIVKYVGPKGEILIDPFHQGKILTPEDCQARIEEAYGGPVTFRRSYLEAVPVRMILYRMLNNLKFIYLRQGDLPRVAQVLDEMLIVCPDSLIDRRDRGLILLEEHRWAEAIEYLSRYLEENPHAPDAELIHRRVQVAYAQRARRN